jgi:hypothetical protein
MAEADRLQNILPDDPLSALAMFQISSAQGQVDASRHLDEAAHRLRPDSDYPTRFFVVQALGYAGRFDDVVDLLQGRVTTARDSPALREFIAAAANADRRTTLNRVLDEIPDEILDIPFYRRARIALAIRLGNIPRVEQEVRAYLKLRPRSVEAHLQFLQVLADKKSLKRCGQRSRNRHLILKAPRRISQLGSIQRRLRRLARRPPIGLPNMA